MAFYELRQYKVRRGKMKEWLKIMEEEIIPFQVSKGMVITGSYQGEPDDSVYIWMRRFRSEAERKRLYKAVYESDTWQNDIAPRIPKLLNRDKMVVTRLVRRRQRRDTLWLGDRRRLSFTRRHGDRR